MRSVYQSQTDPKEKEESSKIQKMIINKLLDII
jgi:hypothetical protein